MTYVAILVGAIVATAFGFLWYSPMLFGKQWMSLSGITDEKMNGAKAKGMWKIYTSNFVITLISVFIIYRFLELLQINSLVGASEFVLWAWLGFVVPIELNPVFWTEKPLKLFVLNSLQYLLAFLLAAIAMILIV